jgi:RNA recognition motif-containing protein
MKDRVTGEPKGFAFATFATRREAVKAAEVLNNMEIKVFPIISSFFLSFSSSLSGKACEGNNI